MSTFNRKVKMDNENWENEFDLVRQYLTKGPFSMDHPGIAAALQGIDQEVKRRYRDTKLRQKFTSATTTVVTECNTATAMDGDYELDVVKIEIQDPTVALQSQTLQTNTTTESGKNDISTSMTDDWQDVTDDVGIGNNIQDDNPNHEDGADESTMTTTTTMAKKVVAVLAKQKVECCNPISALAVVLHVALLQLNYVCTGIPEEPKSGGFAPPIRDLPVGQLLPVHWGC
jgi:hypothetical protein